MKDENIDYAVKLMRETVEVSDWLAANGIEETFGKQHLTLLQRIECHLDKNYTPLLSAPSTLSKATQITFDVESKDIESSFSALTPIEFIPTKDQQAAWVKLEHWLKEPPHRAPYFSLKGYSGTGKSTMTKMILDSYPNAIYITAPTNKAAKVAKKILGRKSSTIYALLGLRMTQEDDALVLTYPTRMPELSYKCLIMVDEAGTMNDELSDFLEQARMQFNAKVLLVGDPMQLRPIGQGESKCWSRVTDKQFRALLKEVKRYDNQLLALSVKLRAVVKELIENPDAKVVNPITDDHDEKGGVYVTSQKKWLASLLPEGVGPVHYMMKKVLAWRNKTVNKYNRIIREHLGFGDSLYAVGELLLIAEPVEIGDAIVATIDEEVSVYSITMTTMMCQDVEVPVYNLLCSTDEDGHLNLMVPTDDGEIVLQDVLNKLADKAKRSTGKARGMAWKLFWDEKKRFHKVRYAYCLTAHRIQGSTLTSVYIDQQDILANPDREEAYRALYVTCTRPTTDLHAY